MASSLSVSLVPYTCGVGARVLGAEQGPSDYFRRGLAQALQAPGRKIHWVVNPDMVLEEEYGTAAHENAPALGTIERADIVKHHVCDLAGRVERATRAGEFVVTLGGDHSMAAGSFTGFARAMDPHTRIGLVWFDAHPDINTHDSSVSKALHGMPVAYLSGIENGGDPFGLGNDGAVLSPANIVYAGLRDIDPPEHEFIRDYSIPSFPMDKLTGRNLANVLTEQMAQMQVDVWVVSLDLDGLDLADAPAVGSPVPGGMAIGSVLEALREIATRFNVGMFEITEHNPTLPGAEVNYATSVAALKAVLDSVSARYSAA